MTLSISEKNAIQIESAFAAARDLEKPEVPEFGTGKPKPSSIVEAYGKLPVHFIENKGQIDSQVKYYSLGRGHAIFFTRDQVVLSLHERPSLSDRERSGLNAKESSLSAEPHRAAVVRLTPIEMTKRLEIIALKPLEGRINYFKGNYPRDWHTNIPTYGAVLYREAYPGIDLKFYGAGKWLEYDIIVKPGADLSRVKFAYSGINSLALTADGDLRVILHNGPELLQKKPMIYQEIGGRRVVREGRFRIEKKRDASFIYSFEVAAYDPQYPLVIDPPILIYSTFLGGSGGSTSGFTGADYADGVAADADGNVYVTGQTWSATFPIKNPLKGAISGTVDCFVTKINADGSAIVYSTFLGGSDADRGLSIAADANGNAYVSGWTASDNFPVKAAFQGTLKGKSDAFVTKLDASGSLVYSTYLGGSDNDVATSLSVDKAGSAYVAGNTHSGKWEKTYPCYTFTTDFPLKNALQPTLGVPKGWLCSGPYLMQAYAGDVFVTKFSPDGQSLIYSTFLGGMDVDKASSIAVDNAGNAYVAGTTWSSDFPVKNAYQYVLTPNPNPNEPSIDVFLTKINAAGSAIVYSTYLGGSLNDYASGVAVDNNGGVYICGWTESLDFPTKNALQSSAGMNDDGFVTKLTENSVGSLDLAYSTYLGGKNPDYCFGIAVDDYGDAYVTGNTSSNVSFPKYDPIQATGNGACDVFIAMIDPSGKFIYSTQLGGNSVDKGWAIAVDKSYNVYVAGETSSTDFPTKVPLQATKGEGVDAFVLKIAPKKLSQKGMMAFFPLNGDVADVSGHQRHGQVHGASPVGNGFEGGAYYFNGKDSYIKVPVYINPNEYLRLTMGAWVKVPAHSLANPSIRQIISSDDGGFDRSLGLDTRVKGFGWSAFAGDHGVLGSLKIVPDKWVFVAVVYDQQPGAIAGTVRLHVDREILEGPGILGMGLPYIYIGANPTFGEYFEGYIDNVFIFDWALKPEEVEYVRRHGAAGILSLRRP